MMMMVTPVTMNRACALTLQTGKSSTHSGGECNNSWHLCSELYQDKALQKRLRVLFLCLEPLEREFFSDIAAQQSGQLGLARCSADRALGFWSKCIVESFRLLESKELFQKLGMETSGVTMAEDRRNESWVQEELALTRMVYNMLIHVSAARAWSQTMFSMRLPQLCAGMLHENLDAKQGSCHVMHRITDAVLAAERKMGKPGVTQCLDQMAWHKLQVARELMKIGSEPWLPFVHLVCS